MITSEGQAGFAGLLASRSSSLKARYVHAFLQTGLLEEPAATGNPSRSRPAAGETIRYEVDWETSWYVCAGGNWGERECRASYWSV